MAAPSPMTLSSATFAKLSPHPFLLANLQPGDSNSTAAVSSSRANGRQPTQARAPAINTSSLSHAHGSAVVRTGDTTVICGVRGETLSTAQIPNYRASVTRTSDSDSDSSDADELRDYDLLVPNIELATGCAPNFLPGVPPTTLAQTLSTRIYSLLHSSRVLDVADLRIYHEPGSSNNDEGGFQQGGNTEEGEGEGLLDVPAREVKAYWVLYIDLLFISLDGNPFDAAWAAVLAALRDAKLPRAYWDADREMVLCSRREPSVPLSVSGLPVACTAAVFMAKERLKQSQSRMTGAEIGPFWILVDPDRFEESLCDETVTVVVDRSVEGDETKILGISKGGGIAAGPEVLRRFVKVAEARWQEFRDAF
ncbi:exosome complex exonuclease RRP43 [Nemania sp. FL0916]|nr:exosome complex exonuclease RRP43 [Nemania sp. FL0916]